MRFIPSFTSHITLIIWILWNKVRKSWQGNAVCQLIKKRNNKQVDIEGQSPALILITMHFYCHPLRKAKWWGWLGCASNFIETSTLFAILLWTFFCTDSSPQLDCLFLYGFVLLAFNCPDNCLLDNWPPDNSNLGQIPPNNCHLGQLPPGNSHLGQLLLNNSLRQFPPRTIVLPPDNYIPTTTAWSNANYKLQFFHGYFLFFSMAQLFNFCYGSNANDSSNKTWSLKLLSVIKLQH